MKLQRHLDRRVNLEFLESRIVLDGVGLGETPFDAPVDPPFDTPGIPSFVDSAHNTHGVGTPTIEEGQSLRVIGPHHTEAGHSTAATHFFAETGDDHHFAWLDQDPSSPAIDILFDYRDLGGRQGTNLITPGQQVMVELALGKWEAATNNKVRFTQDTSAPFSDIIVIGTGNLKALGRTFRSGPGGTLGLGGGTYTHNSDHTITSGVAWMDFQENWDEIHGNGNPSGTIDYFTVAAQEIGHALGLGHMQDLGGVNIMNGIYSGEITDYSANDIEHIQVVYGESVPDTVAPTVIDVDPANGTSDVAITSSITVTFSEPVDSSTVTNSSFTVNDGTIDILGLIAVAADGLSATLTPTAAMTNSTLHTVTLTSAITDVAGNALVPFTSSFSTQAVAAETIVITKATFNSRKGTLNVEATSSLAGATDLTVSFVLDGVTYSLLMTYNSKKDKWTATFQSIAAKPTTLEVCSSTTGVCAETSTIGGK